MNTVQLNTRVSAELRERGAKSFNNAGVNLSEAIRIYLDFAARNLNNPNKVKKILDNLQIEKNEQDIKRKLAIINDSQKIVDKFNKKHSTKIKFVPKSSTLSYKELREKAFSEMRNEKLGA